MVTIASVAVAALTITDVASSRQAVAQECSDVYSEDCAGFIITPPTVEVGGQITISGRGCAANQPIEFRIDGQRIGSGVTGPDGSFTVTIELPDTLGPASYIVTGTCGLITMSNVLVVEAGGDAGGGGGGGGAGGGGGTLPPTGADQPVRLVRLGIVLVTIGGLVLAGSRRRDRGRRT